MYLYIFIEVICEDCMLECSPSRGLDCWDPLWKGLLLRGTPVWIPKHQSISPSDNWYPIRNLFVPMNLAFKHLDFTLPFVEWKREKYGVYLPGVFFSVLYHVYTDIPHRHKGNGFWNHRNSLIFLQGWLLQIQKVCVFVSYGISLGSILCISCVGWGLPRQYWIVITILLSDLYHQLPLFAQCLGDIDILTFWLLHFFYPCSLNWLI